MICPHCRAQNDDDAEMCFTCGRGLGLRQGMVLANRYEILSRLGKGGMGTVYKAHDRDLDENVALKVLRTDLGQSTDLAKRFRSEIKLARKVGHRHVCRIFEYGQHGDLRFIAMELIEGVDLKRLIRERGPLSAPEALEVTIQIAEGLEAIHEHGIVHRDLKTPNIMKDARGVIRLMDFGIAKQFEGGGTTGATATGHVVGTPEYMSPEQARAEKLDARSDIYALGVVAFELFTGDVPFRGDTPVAVLFKHIQEPPPLDGPRVRGIPVPVLPVLRKALAKASADRYASAREMGEALRHARSQWLPTAPRPAPILTAEAPQQDLVEETTPIPTPVSTHAPTVPTTPVPGAISTMATPTATRAPAAEDLERRRQDEERRHEEEARARAEAERQAREAVVRARKQASGGDLAGGIALLEGHAPPHELIVQALAELRAEARVQDQRRRDEERRRREEEARARAGADRQARDAVARAQAQAGTGDLAGAISLLENYAPPHELAEVALVPLRAEAESQERRRREQERRRRDEEARVRIEVTPTHVGAAPARDVAPAPRPAAPMAQRAPVPRPVAARGARAWLLIIPVVVTAAGVAIFIRTQEAVAPSAPASVAQPSEATLMSSQPPASDPGAAEVQSRPAAAPSTLPPATVASLPPSRQSAPAGRAMPSAAAASATPPAARPAPETTQPEPPGPAATPTPAAAPTTLAASAPPATSPPVPDVPRSPGTLRIIVKPWAAVFVDGRNVGMTPLEAMPLSDGTHSIRFVNPLFNPLERSVTIRRGEESRLVVDLNKDGQPKR